MTDENVPLVADAVEKSAAGSVTEAAAEAGAALDPQAASQAAADAANFAGLIANDPDATQRYIDSLLSVIELVDDAGRLMEVLPLW